MTRDAEYDVLMLKCQHDGKAHMMTFSPRDIVFDRSTNYRLYCGMTKYWNLQFKKSKN